MFQQNISQLKHAGLILFCLQQIKYISSEIFFSDSNLDMSEEALEVSVKDDDEKVVEKEDVTKVEGDMGDLKLEGDENKIEEAPADEIGNFFIDSTNNFQTFCNIADIDLTDPDVEAAAVKIQAAFGKKKAKK